MQKDTLFIHVGYPKCGSTSLQVSLSQAEGILYPTSGRHGEEHLSLPLHLKGIDPWTARFFSQEWVRENHAAMMQEVAAASGNVFLSSERLASLTAEQIVALGQLFSDWKIEIIIVQRDLNRYLDSTWRHAVFRHDYAKSKEAFLRKMKNFSFGGVAQAFERHFSVRIFSMDDSNYPAQLEAITGVAVKMGHQNTGVPHELVQLLQRSHALMGSERFKSAFPAQVKEEMRRALVGEVIPSFDPFDVPLF